MIRFAQLVPSDEKEYPVEEKYLREPLDTFRESYTLVQLLNFTEPFCAQNYSVHFDFEAVSHLTKLGEEVVAATVLVFRF